MITYYLVILVLTLPFLSYAILISAEEQLENTFVSHIRSLTRMAAELIESSHSAVADNDIEGILDGVLLSGDGIYATYESQSTQYTSSLNPENLQIQEDFAFGEHGDITYFVKTLIREPRGQGTLILGFDETPTMQAQSTLRAEIVLFMLCFSALSVALLIVLAKRLSRPLLALEAGAKRISSGHSEHRLAVQSGLFEVDQLSVHLEEMRRQLVGTNIKLIEEIEHSKTVEAHKSDLEKQLRQAQKLEAIGTLAGGIAHEFNNLLQPMQLNLEFAIEDTKDQSDVQEVLHSVIASVGRAKALASQILTFGHKGQQHLPPAPIDICKVVAEATTLIKPTLINRAHLHVHLTESPILVAIEPSQIHQIVLNLINNAHQAAETLPCEIQVHATRTVSHLHDPNNGRSNTKFARLTVTDNACGMSDEVKARALEPFFTTRAVGKGTGLGLSVVHGIVSSAGGHMDIISTIGHGTSIDIFLPLVEQSSCD